MAPVEKAEQEPPPTSTSASTVDDTATPVAIRIRTYRPCDHASAVEMFTAGLLLYASIQGQSFQFWDDYCTASIQNDLADIDATYFKRGGHYWVALCDRGDAIEEVIDMVALERKSDYEGELCRMSVKAEYRRFGVGRMLVETLEAWAAAHRYTRVYLSAGYVMARAHAFYRSLGYTLYGDRVLCEDPLFIEGCFEKRLAQPPASA